MIADRLAAVSQFFSVGTNDLTQYTLAVDRGSAHLASRFTPLDPAVLRQLEAVRVAAQNASIPVSICGEMASDPLSAVLLVGMGFTILSVAPPTLPLVKWMVRNVPASVSQEAARQALLAPDVASITRILQQAVQGYVDQRLLAP